MGSPRNPTSEPKVTKVKRVFSMTFIVIRRKNYIYMIREIKIFITKFMKYLNEIIKFILLDLCF